MRGVIGALALGAGCTPDWLDTLASDDPWEVAAAFVDHRSFRVAALQSSLVEPVRNYGSIRLERYGHAWDRLPVRNPTELPEVLPDTSDALLALGRAAFLGYPLTPSRQWQPVLDGVDRSGIDADTLIPVVVGDEVLPADTCATCHSARIDGVRHLGLGNPGLDLGAGAEPPWPVGTVDPSADGLANPVTVADLRPIRHQAALHWTGNLDNGLAALAVRIDTLLITSLGEEARPPRVLPVAIAAWLWSLGDALPEPDRAHPGFAVFEASCAGCHDLDGVAPPVEVATVGTDPAATCSPDRGTGRYRVPTLRGVGRRRPLLHDGSAADLEAMLEPTRAGGHSFGATLSEPDRSDLLGFLYEL